MRVHLDLSTEALVTNIKTGDLVLGYDGQPQRLAVDLISGNEFVKICDVLPSDTSIPRVAQQRHWLDALIETGLAVQVSGHGVWVKRSDLGSIKGTSFDTDKVKALATPAK